MPTAQVRLAPKAGLAVEQFRRKLPHFALFWADSRQYIAHHYAEGEQSRRNPRTMYCFVKHKLPPDHATMTVLLVYTYSGRGVLIHDVQVEYRKHLYRLEE